jgi:ribosomal protein S30
MMTRDIHHCDFCSEPIKSDDASARIYDADDFSNEKVGYVSKGAWLACSTCAAFIRQHDDNIDQKAKHNLAMRALEKNRRKYNIRGMGDVEINRVLLSEIKKLHEAFWTYRTDMPPVPYAIKKIEG